MASLSVVMIVKNEAHRLEKTLKALPEHSQLIIMDGESSDSTVSIARKYTQEIHVRAFDDFANQRNAALAHAIHPWILFLDADEICSPLLRKNIESIVKNPKALEAYRFDRRLIFLGKVVKFGGTREFPIRLFKKDPHLRYEGVVHEVLTLKKRNYPLLDGPLWHDSYPNLDIYRRKLDQYSKLGSLKIPASRKLFMICLSKFWWEFFRKFFIYGGIFDGLAGYHLAMQSSFYGYLKYAYALERNYAYASGGTSSPSCQGTEGLP